MQADALNSASDALSALIGGSGENASDFTLEPEQATPFVNLIDALTSAATAELTDESLSPPPPSPFAPPSPPSALPPGQQAPPPPPLQPPISQEEQNDAEDAAREEQRQRDAAVRNKLADSIGKTLDTLSVALLNRAEPGKQVTLKSEAFTGVFAKQSTAPDPTQPPPKLPDDADAAPAALFVDPKAGDPAASLGSGKATGFVVPSTLPALEGVDAVEVSIIVFPVAIRDGGPPTGRGLVSRVASPSTSLTLRSNGTPHARGLEGAAMQLMTPCSP